MATNDTKKNGACDDDALLPNASVDGGQRSDGASRLAAALVIAAYAACALPKLTTLPRVNVDEPWMMQLAHQLRTTGASSLPMFGLTEPFVLQPGYSLLVAPWMAVAGDGIHPARLLSVLIGALVLYLVYRLGTKLLGRSAGLIAAMFLAVDSNFLGAARTTRHDLMSVLFILAALTCAWSAVRTRAPRWYFLAGMLTAIALLFHANAYWSVLVIGAWFAAADGVRVFRNPGPVLFAVGLGIGLSPVLVRWSDYARQLQLFVGNITPGFSLRRAIESVASEPARYHNWYFGLWTQSGANPWLLVFQGSALAGAAILAMRLARARRAPPVGIEPATLVLLEVAISVVTFACFVPNKAHAYLPNLTIGFAWLGGAAIAAAASAIARPRMTAHAVVTVVVAVYCGSAVWHYRTLFRTAPTAGLTPYEETSAIVRALVPEGRKYVVAFPTFWLPFRDDERTTFLSVTAIAPPGFAPPARTFQYRVPADRLVDMPLYVVVDDAHWKPMIEEDGAFARAWERFLSEHCAVQSAAQGTAYGDFVAYACDPRARPSVTSWLASVDGRWRPADHAVWTAEARAITSWDLYKPGTVLATTPEGAEVTGTAGAGVCTTVPVAEGQRYMLAYDVRHARPGDLVSIAHAAPLAHATARDDSAIWNSLAPARLDRQETAFMARAPQLRLCFYSETATDFTVRDVRLTPLEPWTADGRGSNTPR